jgi:hypothetical protein
MNPKQRIVSTLFKAITTPALLLALAHQAPQASAQPNPNQGPGGPILVITTSTSAFGRYYAEILRTEGLNEFTVLDISLVTAGVLGSYDVAILAPMAVTAGQAGMFNTWVTAGGNLIAMRPDAQLGSLLGLTTTGSALSNAYLVVNTATPEGSGIVAQAMQFHGTATNYTLTGGASAIATLYTNPTTATSNPAVTIRNVGTNGGQAAAFAYDLATSVIYTRQGNPTWASQERDGFSPIRSNDKFYGASVADPQPDWVDLNTLVAIPQADEQMRLLVNLIVQMNLAKRPLPRFWYFPRGKKAVVVMSGDDHGNGGTSGQFDREIALSTAGCSVDNWECVRSTSYMFVQPGNVSNAQAASYTAQGFEVGLHINTGCDNFTPASLNTTYSQQVADFTSTYTSIPAPVTQRHHCIAWSDWATAAKTQLQYGMRLDTSYYFWPPSWVQDRPGHFTGSAMPMRFADVDGTLIDVYNLPSQMTDESGQTYPATSDALLNAAIGAQGFYGVYTVNSHTDTAINPVSEAVIPSALSRGVPVVSSVQMLRWLDGRNSSSFSGITWSGTVLSFAIAPGTGANGLQAMIPRRSNAGVLTSMTGPGGGAVTFTIDVIKGLEYAFFSAAAGTYTATYAADTTAPTVTSTSPISGASGVIQAATVNASFSEPIDPASLTTTTFSLRNSGGAVVPSTVSYIAATQSARLTPISPLAASTTYTATLTTGIEDLSGNNLAANYSWSFTTAAPPTCPCNIWTSSATPANPSVADPNPAELGVKFRADVNGLITGIRFYKGAANTGTHVGNLWTSAGQLLGTATFTNETASGWQQVSFPSPVAVTANTVYVASYHTTSGNYAASNSFFAASGVDNAPLHALQNGVSGGNGVYAYSPTSTFPADTFQSSNYWVDVVFTTTGGGPGPLSVISTSPASGASGVSAAVTVSATFNNSLNPTTINASTFTLRDPGNALVAATYGVNGNTAMLTPTSPLLASTTYTATLTTGVQDSTGSTLQANYTWSFTIAGTIPAGGPEPAGWFSGDIHVHRSCGGPPESISSVKDKMAPQNLAVISLLADMGSGEVQNATTDLPLVNGQDSPVSSPGRIVRWDTEWHWDATYTQYPHQALGGHLLALGLTNAQQIWEEYTFPILNWARQQGAIAGFAHMQYLDGGIPTSLTCCTPIEYPVEVALGAADFISEDVDDNGSPFSMQPENFIAAYYKLLNTGFRPGFAAGTDYPCNANRDLGSLLTYVQIPSGQLTYRNWIDNIKTGRTVVSRNGHREFIDLKVNGNSSPGDQIGIAAAGSLPVTVQWTALQNFTGTLEIVNNGVVVASQQATVTPGTPVTLSTTVNFPRSGWIAARRMSSEGHQLHTAAVFVLVNNAPIRVSAADAQFYVQWMDNLLTRTSAGGPWNSFFPTQLAAAQARYQAAKTIFQQRASEATGPTPLAVVSTVPATGATGVNVSTAVTATFNNPLNAATITATSFVLRDAGNTQIAATYSVSGSTATLTPGNPLVAATTYTATLTTAVRDVNGTALVANYTWSFTTSGGPGTSCTNNCTIWPGSTLPGTLDGGPDSPVELGVKFRAEVNGTISGIRFYKSAANTGTHVANLWSSTGQLLGSAPFTGETASGWQQVNFATPVSITANTVYVASYHTTVGHYSADLNFFASSGVDTPPLHALRDGESGSNSVYAYGSGNIFPTQSFNATNYWVDVVFSSAATPTLTSIAVTPANPSIPAGNTQQFTATGTYSDSSTQNITSQVTWTSSSAAVATINSAGLASGVGAGSTTITAAQGSVSGNTTLTVQSGTALSITTSSLPGGTVSVAYTATLAASGGTSPYTWSLASGTLPAGLNLNAAGSITGTPTTAGSSTFTVRVTDSAAPAATVTRSLTITIAAAPTSLSITTAALPGGTVGASYSATLAASGGTTPYTWSLASGTLPPGLTLSATGSISGTPTTAGTSTFTVRVTDSAVPAATVTRSLSIAIVAPVLNTGFRAPTSQSAVTLLAGDNNGFQSNPANAFTTNGQSALDSNSGTSTSTSCTNSGKDKHNYFDYGFALPAGVAIRGIEVRLDAAVNNTGNTPRMCVQLSWNGGSSWTATNMTPTLTTTTATYTLGGATDTWGRTWTVGNLANGSFRVRIINVAGSTARTFSLDGVAVRVTYQ